MSKTELENSLHLLKNSRRAHRRFPYETDITVQMSDETIPAVASNLSLGGIFITFAGKLHVGDRITLLLTLPGLPQETVPTEVRWTIPRDEKHTGCGLAFLHLSDRAMNAIITLSTNEELRSV